MGDILISVDKARNGTDYSCVTTYKVLPDNKIMVVEVDFYKDGMRIVKEEKEQPHE